MKRISLFILAISVCILSSVAQEIKGRYAIQNIETGKNLRPYDASNADGNKIVLYDHVEWKCMTWDFIHVKNNSYQLKNRFTGKTFQPSAKATDRINLVQQPLSKDSIQYWEFEKSDNNAYYIKLKGTVLYITLSSKNTNSNIIIKPKQNGLSQMWKLVAQDPNF